ncbi:clavesin-2-like [Toxorhynchites rutilus septentrionalis]|uniref:clavesin-2-like n=1 Tax=Toxorhynchites rutilus septentrionalis TaxID=329112 RepID=UPI0024793313|nr:clavesin-2-like [Toxorhynchites rutilus septentrionalis]
MNVPSVEKSLKQYEVYKFTLSEQYRKTALDELRESDETRRQALEQLREWVVKNPAILGCRMDALFLLRFLRVRKFNHLQACETLERYLVMNQRYPKWFRKLDTAEPWVDEMIEDWPLLPLGYDKAGRLVLLAKMGNVNLERFTNAALVRLFTMAMETYYDEEKVQITGTVHIYDDTDITMGHIAQWPITDIIAYMKCVKHSFPQRIREIHLLNMPRYAAATVELCLNLLSEKMRTRFYQHRSVKDMTKIVDQSILPKEYGGNIPIDELQKQFRQRLTKYRDTILALDQMEVDESKLSPFSKNDNWLENDSGVIGSFRKLNVD